MLKTLLIFIFSLNLAFAARFSEAEKKEFINGVKEELADVPMVDLQVIKPVFEKSLQDLEDKNKITKDEELALKSGFEELSRNKSITKVNSKAAFISFLEQNLQAIDQREIPKAGHLEQCNSYLTCKDGLICLPDSDQNKGNQCRNSGNSCGRNSDCCSNECVVDANTKKGICEDVSRCQKILSEGQSCTTNLVCGTGSCLPYDKGTDGVGTWAGNFNACTNNDDCASNLCVNKICQPNFICKQECSVAGEKEARGKKCCEGYYPKEDGTCSRIKEPWVQPAVKFSPKKTIFTTFLNIFISNAEAQTQDTHQINSDLSVEETLRNFTAGSKAECEEAISSVLEGRTGTCTLGGGCGASCGKPSASCPSANPTAYGLCAKASELGYLPGFEPKTAEEIKAEEDAFLTKQNDLVNSDIVGTIKGAGDKYGYGFQGESDKVAITEKKKGKLVISRKSNFETCEIKFKDDFMTYLNKNNLLELEMALLGFDFVMSGEGVNDYWSPNGNGDSSIYARLKAASKISKDQRAKLWERIAKTNDQLTCMCLDAQGLKNIKLDTKKEFFIKSCPEYAKYSDPNVKQDELDGDASGLKAKKLLVTWTGKLAEFNAGIVVDHGNLKEKVVTVLDYMKDDQIWNNTKTVTYPLFNFNIKNPSGSAAALGAILGAVLAAGVIAIMGGFGTASILTAWGVTGIITLSAVTGAGGLWMISSLRGAWISKKPEIFDRHVRTYGCGKKETCAEYSRELIQPFNNVCNKHISSNACVKDFMVIREKVKKNNNSVLTEESIFLVDPWVPYNVPTNLLIKDSINGNDYATMLEKGFQKAKGAMVAKNPQATGGGGKKGGGEFVPESYMSEVFLDPALVGQYVPQLGSNLEEKYFLRDKQIQVIKKAAIDFALEQKFFEKEDTDNLKVFSEYAYEFHFLYPKRSRLNEISYPSLGLTNYVELMANNVISGIAVGAAGAVGDASRGFTNTNMRYLEDYRNTLQMYHDALNQADAVKKAALKKEIAAVDGELERLKMISALIQNPANDSSTAMTRAISEYGNANVGKGATLSAADQAYLGAIGKLRSDRKDQVKKYAAYKKAIAASGKKSQADKVAKATMKFNNKFTKPISTASGLGTSLADTVNSAESENSSGGAGGDASGKNGAGGSIGADAYANVAPFGSSSSTGFGASGSYGKNNSGADGMNGMNSKKGAGMSEEDRKRLADAIDARNRASSSQYQSNDGQSLFEKVTNAYIRNYDKVLSKKKDKDVLEAK